MAAHAWRWARFIRACWWLALGIAILPLKPRSKHLQPGFGPRQARVIDQQSARRWFLNTDANLGLVLGDSPGLVVADWDDASAFHAWRAALGATVDSLTERTARGYHVFFFAPALPSAADRTCELKTHGACMVAPSLHPAGIRYHVTCPAPIATLDAVTAYSLFPFLSQASAAPAPLALARPTPTQVQTGLVGRIKAARPILDELRAVGIALRSGGQGTLVGCCPFHADHAPSLWVYPDRGLWGCNRPDCLAAGAHDVINFRARWCGISNQAAIRQLAHEFL